MLKFHSRDLFFIRIRLPHKRSVLHIRLFFKHALDPVRTRQCFRDRNDQIRKLHQFHQNLGHIVEQRHNLTLRQFPDIDPDRTGVYKHDHRPVDHNISKRIHQSRNTSDKLLCPGEKLIILLKPAFFILFFVKCPNHSRPRQILSRHQKDLIQMRLHLLIERHRHQHDGKYDHSKQRNRYYKHKSRFDIDHKRHDHRPEDDERGTKQQTKRQIQPGLHLIQVTRHPGDKGRCPNRIHLRKCKLLHMRK